MAHFEAEIDILKCKIYVRHTFGTSFSEITKKVGQNHKFLQLIFLYIS